MKCVHGISIRIHCSACVRENALRVKNDTVVKATREQKKEFWGLVHYTVDKTNKTR